MLAGQTKDISSAGVLFTSVRGPDPGGPIEYIITLNQQGSQAVSIKCIGKVVRAQRLTGLDKPAFEVAATLERYEFARER